MINSNLATLEQELLRQVADLSEPLRKVCSYAVQGGQRTSASLLLALAGTEDPRAVRAAAALELLHAATLLQDDIFDSGSMRRGWPATHVRFGKPLAILASDWLLIRSLALAAELDSTYACCLSSAALGMAEAEARELEPASTSSLEEANLHGRHVAEGKTATLFGAALFGAAAMRRLPLTTCNRWQQLGLQIGLSYQIVDDCGDIFGDECTAGKSLGHDLDAGCLTSPVLLGILRLQEQGTFLSILDLQHGRLTDAKRRVLVDSMRSNKVREQLLAHLEDRFAAHCTEAKSIGVAANPIVTFTRTLRERTIRYLKLSANADVVFSSSHASGNAHA